MKITDEKWDEIVAATRESIERWNTRAAEHGCEDKFRWEVQTGATHAVLKTAHIPGRKWSTPDWKAAARELATGELRAAKPVIKKGQLTGFTIRTPDPKAWQALGDKSASEIVRGLKLTDFSMLLGVRTSATSTSTTIAGQHFGPEETEALDTICRERNISMMEAVEIFRAKS